MPSACDATSRDVVVPPVLFPESGLGCVFTPRSLTSFQQGPPGSRRGRTHGRSLVRAQAVEVKRPREPGSQRAPSSSHDHLVLWETEPPVSHQRALGTNTREMLHSSAPGGRDRGHLALWCPSQPCSSHPGSCRPVPAPPEASGHSHLSPPLHPRSDSPEHTTLSTLGVPASGLCWR